MAVVHIRTRQECETPLDLLYESARELGTDPAHWLIAAKQLEQLGVPDSTAQLCATQLFHRTHALDRLATPPPEPAAI